MIYEVINPSDCCTFESPSHEVAALVVFLLGHGAYAGSCHDGPEVPIFLLGGAEEWYLETFGRSVSDGLGTLKTETAEALRSLIYASASDRAAILASGGDLAKFNDHKRSSLNDINARARRIAQGLEAGS